MRKHKFEYKFLYLSMSYIRHFSKVLKADLFEIFKTSFSLWKTKATITKIEIKKIDLKQFFQKLQEIAPNAKIAEKNSYV